MAFEEAKSKIQGYDKSEIDKLLLIHYFLKNRETHKYLFTENIDYKDNMIIAIEAIRSYHYRMLLGNY